MIVISSFILGEVTELIRTSLFRVPGPFHYFIYHYTDDQSKLTKYYRINLHINEKLPHLLSEKFFDHNETEYLPERLNFDFRLSMEGKFNVDFDTDEPRDIYDMLILYLEPNMSPRTQRHQSLYAFFLNLWIAFVISAAVYMVEVAYQPSNSTLVLSTLSLSIIFVVLVIISLILIITPHVYFESLLKEYYNEEINR